MVYIFKDRLIRVEWTIYKGISPVKEDFSRSNVKVFLLGNREKYLLQARADKGTLYVDIPSGLEEGTYSIEAIWVKNMDHVFDTRSVCRSKKEDLFSITEFEDEATNIGEGVVVLKVKTSTATYGYDGLSSYELAVLRGDWNGTEGEWLKHERYVSVLDSRGDSEIDTMSQKAITDELEAQDNAIEDIREDTEKLDNRVEKAEDKVNNMGDVVDEIKSHAPVSARPAGFKPDIDLTPEIMVDRAWRDHEGNVIRDTYITRRGLRNEIIDITNQQVTDLKPGSVDPDDLSEATKQLIGNKSITNLPDEEDITVTDNQTLKLKDKEYAPKDYSGMGRVYLRKHYVNGVNTLTQHMMRKPNTIYIIQYDYCLAGQTIEVPENCVLDFQGGSLRNGTIKCNDTTINGTHVLSDIILTGDYNEGVTQTDLFIIDNDITQILTTLLNDTFCKVINVNGDFQFNPVNVNLIRGKKLNINGIITLTSTFNINRSIEITGIGVNTSIQFGKPVGGIFIESKNFEGDNLFLVKGSDRKVFNNIALKSKKSITVKLIYSETNVGALYEFNDVQFYSENNYCVYIDTVFWVWFNRCIIYSTIKNNIYVYSRGVNNSYVGLIKIYDSIIAIGNIKIDSTVGGGIDIKDCVHENLKEGESLIEVINGQHFRVSLDNVEVADAHANVYTIDANNLNVLTIKNHRGEVIFKTEKRPVNYSNDFAYRNTIYTASGISFEDRSINSGETSYGISTYKNIYRGYSPISIGAGYNIPIGNRYATNTNYFTKEQFSFNGTKTAALLVNNTEGTIYPQLFSIATPKEILSKTGWVVVTCMVKRKEGNYPFSYDWSSFSSGTATGDFSYENLNGEASRSTPLYESYINTNSWHLAGSVIKVNKFGNYLFSNIVLLYKSKYLISKPTLKFYDATIYTLEDVINIIKGVGYQGDKEGVGVIGDFPFMLGNIDSKTAIPAGSIACSEDNLVLGTSKGNIFMKKQNPNIVYYNNSIPSNTEDYDNGDIVYIYYGKSKGLVVKDGDKFVRWDGELASNPRQGNSSERPTEIGTNGYFYMDTQLNVPIWNNRKAWIEADGQPAGILRIGTSGQRPTTAKAGFQYFDTVLSKPIWWTGTNWVDATGATV